MAKTKRRPTGDYETGYARPPKHSQFPKRTSGNPGGRSKDSKEYRDIALKILNKKHIGMKDGKPCRMSTFEIGFNNLANKAAMGDRLAWREMINTIERLGIKLDHPEQGGGLIFRIDYGPPDPEDTPQKHDPGSNYNPEE